MQCKGCKKIDTMERRTYQPAYVAYEEIKGIRLNSFTCKWELEVDPIVTPMEPEVSYQCSYCGKEYSEEEVMTAYIKEG